MTKKSNLPYHTNKELFVFTLILFFFTVAYFAINLSAFTWRIIPSLSQYFSWIILLFFTFLNIYGFIALVTRITEFFNSSKPLLKKILDLLVTIIFILIYLWIISFSFNATIKIIFSHEEYQHENLLCLKTGKRLYLYEKSNYLESPMYTIWEQNEWFPIIFELENAKLLKQKPSLSKYC